MSLKKEQKKYYKRENRNANAEAVGWLLGKALSRKSKKQIIAEEQMMEINNYLQSCLVWLNKFRSQKTEIITSSIDKGMTDELKGQIEVYDEFITIFQNIIDSVKGSWSEQLWALYVNERNKVVVPKVKEIRKLQVDLINKFTNSYLNDYEKGTLKAINVADDISALTCR